MPTIRGMETGSKKRYAGLSHNKMVFKGLETVRTDWTPLAQAFQKSFTHASLISNLINSLFVIMLLIRY